MIGVIGDVVDWTTVGLAKAPAAAAILPNVIQYLTNPIIATVGLGAIAAAVMSSVDSSILSASSMAGWNVYRPLLKPKAEPKELAKIIQKCVWIIGIAGTIIAINVSSVYKLWFFSADLVYCILFPQLTLALFSKKVNWKGALAGFIAAGLIRFGSEPIDWGFISWQPFYQDTWMTIFPDSKMFPKGENLLAFRTVAMMVNYIVMYAVSLMTQKSCPPMQLVMPGAAGEKN
jgi:high affinity choline transporter 7